MLLKIITSQRHLILGMAENHNYASDTNIIANFM